ncbi:MAG: FHA domain-containing protein [Clostridia bacterium]|nr:FHA domain-containing protein [Clostridia bacterium]
MSAEFYQVLSLAMRYWFALLGILIVLRSFYWLHKDRRARHRRLRRLPDAGLIGEMVVLSDLEGMPAQTALAVPYEGILGSVRGCDIPLPAPGIQARHLDFWYDSRQGLMIRPRKNRYCTVDGEEASFRHPLAMGHGSILQLGPAALRLRLFAGLETEYHARFQDDVLPPTEAMHYGVQPGKEPDHES